MMTTIIHYLSKYSGVERKAQANLPVNTMMRILLGLIIALFVLFSFEPIRDALGVNAICRIVSPIFSLLADGGGANLC